MLDIIIAHYNEPWETGAKLFQMIGLQRDVDLSLVTVTVVNDGGMRLPEEELKRLRYPVKQIDIPHGGISKARNTGIEQGSEPFIMFCDFDDTFTNIYALRDIMSVLPCDYDMLWTQLLVEDCTDGKNLIYPTPERQRFVFIHGKVYRRQFLVEQGIRFNEEMCFQEDSLFNATIIARTDYKRIGQIRAPIVPYAWIRRKNSVTNSGREDEAIYWHFRRNMMVAQENESNYEKYCGMVTRTAYDAYYMIMGKRASGKMKERILEEFAPWIACRMDQFGDVPEDIMQKLTDVSKYELLDPDESMRDDLETVRAWLQKIIRKAEG